MPSPARDIPGNTNPSIYRDSSHNAREIYIDIGIGIIFQKNSWNYQWNLRYHTNSWVVYGRTGMRMKFTWSCVRLPGFRWRCRDPELLERTRFHTTIISMSNTSKRRTHQRTSSLSYLRWIATMRALLCWTGFSQSSVWFFWTFWKVVWSANSRRHQHICDTVASLAFYGQCPFFIPRTWMDVFWNISIGRMQESFIFAPDVEIRKHNLTQLVRLQ